jgi:hypothetical protein
VNALIKRWHKHGVPRDEVTALRLVHDNDVRIATEKRQAKREREQARKRKRKQWPKGRIEHVQEETHPREARKQKKVDTLLDLALGKIK